MDEEQPLIWKEIKICPFSMAFPLLRTNVFSVMDAGLHARSGGISNWE
jgi:hypothetical protein